MYWNYKYYEHFFVGGTVCEIRNQTTNDHYGIRWRWPLLLVKCMVTEQRAGGWNASMIHTWKGRTWNHSQALYPMHDWSLAMYELFPGWSPDLMNHLCACKHAQIRSTYISHACTISHFSVFLTESGSNGSIIKTPP